jgi:hypothetical protein
VVVDVSSVTVSTAAPAAFSPSPLTSEKVSATSPSPLSSIESIKIEEAPQETKESSPRVLDDGAAAAAAVAIPIKVPGFLYEPFFTDIVEYI